MSLIILPNGVGGWRLEPQCDCKSEAARGVTGALFPVTSAHRTFRARLAPARTVRLGPAWKPDWNDQPVLAASPQVCADQLGQQGSARPAMSGTSPNGVPGASSDKPVRDSCGVNGLELPAGGIVISPNSPASQREAGGLPDALGQLTGGGDH